MERVDGVGNGWYNTLADNLYLYNFVFFTRMQTMCCMTDRYCHKLNSGSLKSIELFKKLVT